MKLFTRIYLPVILLFSMLLSGCIKEDVSDCPSGLKIYFTYTPATYARTGINESEVDKINLYVFDADAGGILRGVWVDPNPVLSPEYYMTINNLPAGNYRFIAWCDVQDCYTNTPNDFIIGQTTYNEALLRLDHNAGIAANVTPLFHAQKTESVLQTGEQKIYLPLVQAYNTINLTTEGLLQSSDTYRMTIYDDNGHFYFDYSFAPCSEFKYATFCNKDAQGQLQATLNILKLAADRHPVIEIKNITKGTVLYRENLVALINETGSTSYDMIHTYDIHLSFGLSVSVNINGWWVVNDGEIGLK